MLISFRDLTDILDTILARDLQRWFQWRCDYIRESMHALGLQLNDDTIDFAPIAIQVALLNYRAALRDPDVAGTVQPHPAAFKRSADPEAAAALFASPEFAEEIIMASVAARSSLFQVIEKNPRMAAACLYGFLRRAYDVFKASLIRAAAPDDVKDAMEAKYSVIGWDALCEGRGEAVGNMPVAGFVVGAKPEGDNYWWRYDLEVDTGVFTHLAAVARKEWDAKTVLEFPLSDEEMHAQQTRLAVKELDQYASYLARFNTLAPRSASTAIDAMTTWVLPTGPIAPEAYEPVASSTASAVRHNEEGVKHEFRETCLRIKECESIPLNSAVFAVFARYLQVIGPEVVQIHQEDQIKRAARVTTRPDLAEARIGSFLDRTRMAMREMIVDTEDTARAVMASAVMTTLPTDPEYHDAMACREEEE
jgi:hypothetical protein